MFVLLFLVRFLATLTIFNGKLLFSYYSVYLSMFFSLHIVAASLMFVIDGSEIHTWKTDDAFIIHLSTVASQVCSKVKKSDKKHK